MVFVFSLTTMGVAQDEGKTTEILSTLAAPCKVEALSIEQRATKLSSFGLLPADTSACLSVLGLGDAIIAYEKTWDFPNCSPDLQQYMIEQQESKQGIYGINDILIAGGAELPQGIMAASSLLDILSQLSVAQEATAILSKSNFESTFQASYFSAWGKWIQQGKITPILAIISIKPEALQSYQENVSSIISSVIPSGLATAYTFTYQGIDFSGVHISGKLLINNLKDQKPIHLSLAEYQAFLKELSKLDCYLLVGFKDDKIIFSLTQDPKTQLKLAATPQESILATEKLAFTDQANDALAIGYADAATSEAIASVSQCDSPSEINGLIQALELTFPQHSDGVISSLKALGINCQNMSKLGKSNQAMTLLAWWDKGLQLELTEADQNLVGTCKPLKINVLADRPENIFYAAASLNPELVTQLIESCENGVSAVWQFAEFYLPMMAARSGTNSNYGIASQISSIMPLAKMCKPELIKLWNAAKPALKGMISESALVIDDKGTMPRIPAVSEEQAAQMIIPRIAYATGLTDRTKISQSWDKMVISLNELMLSLSDPTAEDEATSALSGITKNEVKGLTTYSYPAPFFTTGCNPCLSISDQLFILGTAPRLNQEIAEAWTANPTKELQGAVFAFKTEPVFNMFRINYQAISKAKFSPDSGLPVVIFLRRAQGIYCTLTTEDGVSRFRLSIPWK